MLVLKGIFGGSLKITSENQIIFEAKNSLKRFLGYTKNTENQFFVFLASFCPIRCVLLSKSCQEVVQKQF